MSYENEASGIKIFDKGDKTLLYLYGIIRSANQYDQKPYRGFITSEDVITAVNSCEKDLEIHINSRGGDAFESLAIYNALCDFKKSYNLTCCVDGLAGSGASIITAAADKVYMRKSAMQFIHGSLSSAFGHAEDLRKAADDLDALDTAIRACYLAKFVGNEDELKELMACEKFLTAQQCLAFGLCTDIIEEKSDKNPQNDITMSLFNKYSKNEPQCGLLQKYFAEAK